MNERMDRLMNERIYTKCQTHLAIFRKRLPWANVMAKSSSQHQIRTTEKLCLSLYFVLKKTYLNLFRPVVSSALFDSSS